MVQSARFVLPLKGPRRAIGAVVGAIALALANHGVVLAATFTYSGQCFQTIVNGQPLPSGNCAAFLGGNNAVSGVMRIPDADVQDGAPVEASDITFFDFRLGNLTSSPQIPGITHLNATVTETNLIYSNNRFTPFDVGPLFPQGQFAFVDILAVVTNQLFFVPFEVRFDVLGDADWRGGCASCNGQNLQFLGSGGWTRIPEPSPWILLTTGLAGLFAFRALRQRKAASANCA